jgi:hypothetical protein
MYHEQNCCENVEIDDIVGDLYDLINSPVIKASENSNDGTIEDVKNKGINQDYDYIDSSTWTFYNISTIKGHVTIKWFGWSNGYYSERVTFYKIKN